MCSSRLIDTRGLRESTKLETLDFKALMGPSAPETRTAGLEDALQAVLRDAKQRRHCKTTQGIHAGAN